MARPARNMDSFELFISPVPEEISDDTLRGLFSQLPPWRLEKALSYRRHIDRFLCAKAYLLLKEGLSKLYGINCNPDFAYGPAGKPYLKKYPSVHFNLSHCSTCVCCVISSSEVGVDVEDIQYDQEVAARVFNASERKRIDVSGRPDIEFTRLWTMKESYLKLTGDGLCDDLRNLLCSAELPAFRTAEYPDKGYVLTVACHPER